MKQCPFCAEDIKDAAIVCRYCGRDLPEATSETATVGVSTDIQRERVNVVGKSHHQKAIQAVLTNSGRQFHAIVKPEPGNHVNKNAIRICSPTSETIGYLPKEVAANHKGHFDSGLTTVPATITDSEGEEQHLDVVLSWKDRSTVGPSEANTGRRRSSSSPSVGVALVVILLVVGGFLWFGGVFSVTDDSGRAVMPQRLGAPPPVATRAEFDQISNGMTYQGVVGIIGAPGELLSSSDLVGIKTVMYSWANANGSNVNAMFQNDALVQKAQFGLP